MFRTSACHMPRAADGNVHLFGSRDHLGAGHTVPADAPSGARVIVRDTQHMLKRTRPRHLWHTRLACAFNVSFTLFVGVGLQLPGHIMGTRQAPAGRQADATNPLPYDGNSGTGMPGHKSVHGRTAVGSLSQPRHLTCSAPETPLSPLALAKASHGFPTGAIDLCRHFGGMIVWRDGHALQANCH